MLFVRVALYVVLFGEILLAEQYWNRFIQHLDIFLSEITFYVLYVAEDLRSDSIENCERAS